MSLHVVVIGGVALGPKAACRFKRLMSEGRVTMIDQSAHISYGGCGIPFYVSGEISRVEELQSTSYGLIRDVNFFREAKGVDVLTRTKVIKIDRANKTVRAKNMDTGEEKDISYDKLVVATGARARELPIPGSDLGNISAATNLVEAEVIKAAAAAGKINKAVVVGAGFIGLEMAVAFADLWGIEVDVIEFAGHILPATSSPLLAEMATKDLEANGVSVYCDEQVQKFEGENGKVCRVITNKRTIEADFVVMSTGFVPNTEIAIEAGIKATPQGLLLVDEYMRTSDPDIYSGGDCVAIKNQITGQPFWLPLGSQANRQGRIVGTNLAGGNDTFPGAIGSWGVKLFELSVAGAGMTLAAAKKAGFDAISVHVEQVDRAHFYPEHSTMALEAIVEKKTRRLLGVMGICAAGDGLTGRINATAPYIANKGTVSDLSNLELIYSPPFASAMDIINALGNVADNILSGRCISMQTEEFVAAWEKRDPAKTCFLDVRDTVTAEPFVKAHPENWKNIPMHQLRKKITEVPKDKELVLICDTGLRSYEAQLILVAAGYSNSKNVAGGMAGVKAIGKSII